MLSTLLIYILKSNYCHNHNFIEGHVGMAGGERPLRPNISCTVYWILYHIYHIGKATKNIFAQKYWEKVKSLNVLLLHKLEKDKSVLVGQPNVNKD